MLPDFRPNRWTKFQRAIYIVCAVLVCSYIFFDVLDLDGSDFPLKQQPLERTAIVSEVAKDADCVQPLNSHELWVGSLHAGPDRISQSFTSRVNENIRLSGIHRARVHRYRIALPRSSTIDPLHSL
jgi:hypothetical protein